jgi:hypothetical protein
MSKFAQLRALSKTPADFKLLQESTPGIDSTPDIKTIPAYETIPDVKSRPAVELTPGIRLTPAVQSTPGVAQGPGIGLIPGIAVSPRVNSTPAVGSLPGIETRKPKPRLARLAQDGHSLGEQAVYQALWENGAGSPDGNRVIKVGFGSLSRLARLAERNCRLNVRSLIDKLAVEEIRAENCSSMEGKTYRVYNYSTILDRRRAAGMVYVIRTKGVRFVSISGVESSPGVESSSPVESPPAVQSAPEAGIESSPGPGIESTPLYRNSFRKENQEEESSSSPNSSVIVERLSRLGVKIDDDAAMRIIRRCENADSTATPDEIAHFAELKVQQLAKRRNVENWPGMLISAVPAYFDAPATELQRYRTEKEMEQGRELEIARMILDDPETPEEDKQWARAAIEQSRAAAT